MAKFRVQSWQEEPNGMWQAKAECYENSSSGWYALRLFPSTRNETTISRARTREEAEELPLKIIERQKDILGAAEVIKQHKDKTLEVREV